MKHIGRLWTFFFGKPFACCVYCGQLNTVDALTFTGLGYFCNREEAEWFAIETGLSSQLAEPHPPVPLSAGSKNKRENARNRPVFPKTGSSSSR